MISSERLVDLLRPARARLKWVTLSACLSAAATAEETRRWLSLERARVEVIPAHPRRTVEPRRRLSAVAEALVRALDCAVLAMRYPVGDEFAIALAEQVYEGVLDRGQPLTRAIQLALPRISRGADCPPLSIAAPALFGRCAVDLELLVRRSEIPIACAAHLLPASRIFQPLLITSSAASV